MRGMRTFLVGLFCTSVGVAQSFDYRDNSDWWSLFNGNSKLYDDQQWKAARVRRNPAVSLTQIAGVSFIPNPKNKVSPITQKFGEARAVNRGDASTGREQVCYTSTIFPNTFLIFEGGELIDSAYLFQDERSWNGRDACTKSVLVSPRLKIAGGLRLGQSLSAMEAVIGKPSRRIGNEALFLFERWTPRSKEELEKIHLHQAQMEDDEFLKRFRYSKVSISVLTRFRNSQLVYVVVSQSDVFDY